MRRRFVKRRRRARWLETQYFTNAVLNTGNNHNFSSILVQDTQQVNFITAGLTELSNLRNWTIKRIVGRYLWNWQIGADAARPVRLITSHLGIAVMKQDEATSTIETGETTHWNVASGGNADSRWMWTDHEYMEIPAAVAFSDINSNVGPRYGKIDVAVNRKLRRDEQLYFAQRLEFDNGFPPPTGFTAHNSMYLRVLAVWTPFSQQYD